MVCSTRSNPEAGFCPVSGSRGRPGLNKVEGGGTGSCRTSFIHQHRPGRPPTSLEFRLHPAGLEPEAQLTDRVALGLVVAGQVALAHAQAVTGQVALLPGTSCGVTLDHGGGTA